MVSITTQLPQDLEQSEQCASHVAGLQIFKVFSSSYEKGTLNLLPAVSGR